MRPASGHTRMGLLSSAAPASLWHPSAEAPGVGPAVAVAAAAASVVPGAPSLPQASAADWHGSEAGDSLAGTLGLNLK